MVLCCAGATKDMGKMLGGEEEKDPDAQKKEEERQEALRQQEEERKAKHARMEAEREKVRQQIRDKCLCARVRPVAPCVLVSAAHAPTPVSPLSPGPPMALSQEPPTVLPGPLLCPLQ
ncbi:complexin-2 [Egretta garzetta]|uniref:complexin-2 n=1 Tax=Egretta garzetta TaxID=188379 RepID=UPI00163CDED0|nr:complexin-2 [Egretta garzetta]